MISAWADIDIHAMRSALEEANAAYFGVLNLIDSSNKPILGLEEYERASYALAYALHVYRVWGERISYETVVVLPRRQRDLDKVLHNLVYYTNAAQLLMVTLTHPGLAAVISEVAENTDVVPQSFVLRIIYRTQHSFRTRVEDSSSPVQHYGSLFDAVTGFSSWRLQSRPQWLVDYINRAKAVMGQTQYLSSRRFTGEVHKEIFYGITSGLLFLTGKIALPKPYFITNNQIEQIYLHLEPGDIAVIKHLYKLTNVAFQGEWSHGLIFLDSWERMKNYFDSDSETNQYFRQKCREEGFSCTTFSSYLESAEPEAVEDHRALSKYRGHDVSRVVLESKGEGVIISNLYEGLKKDQLAVMRPRMSKKAKAISLLRALQFMRRPYDYGFSLHSRQRLVCTEIIYNAYSPGAGSGVPNFNWDISVVLGKPVNYATDIVKTFAQNYGTNQQRLDLLFFMKANEAEGRAHQSTVDEFLQTAQ